jgi:hypothetical protein
MVFDVSDFFSIVSFVSTTKLYSVPSVQISGNFCSTICQSVFDSVRITPSKVSAAQVLKLVSAATTGSGVTAACLAQSSAAARVVTTYSF